MAPFTNAGGHDLTNKLNLDSLGQLYIIVTAAWTALLASGITFLLSNQKLTILRMRKIWLSIIAISTLHVYWCLCMLAYVLNGYFPCQVEFWVMSTFLPWGIAFYQVVNTQLLYYATLQKKIAIFSGVQIERKEIVGGGGLRKIWSKWKLHDVMTRTMIGLACGLAAQITVTLILFFGSRRMHPSFGMFGHKVDVVACRTGFEWWPSFAWQLIWSWIYAPYLLYKIRGIDDVHGWRLQTVICSVAGLPATPLWIAGVYSKSFASINKYWVPPLWYSPGIMVMEASLIFIPCWQVLKNRNLRKETLDILALWEHEKQVSTTGDESILATNSTLSSSNCTTKSSKTSPRRSTKGQLYSRQALEKALNTNPTRLLLFAALKDFSGENISFLNHVHKWRAAWTPLSKSRYSAFTTQNHRSLEGEALWRHQFNLAVEIYLSFVSMQHSDFPINLSSAHLKELNAVFENPAATIMTTTPVPYDAARTFKNKGSRPFDFEHGSDTVLVSITALPTHGETDPVDTSTTFGMNARSVDKLSLLDLKPRLPPSTPISDAFGPGIFDHAEESIKYTVLTNTWPRFVDAGHANNLEQKSTNIIPRLGDIQRSAQRALFGR